MTNKKENLILRYLELTYGHIDVVKNNDSGLYTCSKVFLYNPKIKQFGWTGKVRSDLVRWFGESESLTPLLKKWASQKYGLEIE